MDPEPQALARSGCCRTVRRYCRVLPPFVFRSTTTGLLSSEGLSFAIAAMVTDRMCDRDAFELEGELLGSEGRLAL